MQLTNKSAVSRKILFWSFICLLLINIPQSTFATTEVNGFRYVKPSSEVVVRTGKGTDFKVVAMVKDGAKVDFIEEDESYTKVRLSNGVEGWMLKRFLSVEPPLIELVESLRNENNELKSEAATVTQKTEELSNALIKAQKKVTGLITERDQFKSDYNTLAQDTADVQKIKQNQLKTAKENETLSVKLAAAQEKNSGLSKDKTLNWFLAGAGVFLIGILFGKMPGPSRRRKSSLI